MNNWYIILTYSPVLKYTITLVPSVSTGQHRWRKTKETKGRKQNNSKQDLTTKGRKQYKYNALRYLQVLGSTPDRTTQIFFFQVCLCHSVHHSWVYVFQLEEVMEKETYKAAKDLLDKYDPNSEIVKVCIQSFSENLFLIIFYLNIFVGEVCPKSDKAHREGSL